MADKHCSKCGELKPLEEFYVRNKMTGARRTECRRCLNQAHQKSRLKPMAESVVSRSCSVCHETKPIEEFNLLSKNGTKRSSRCKPCKALYESELRLKAIQKAVGDKCCTECGVIKPINDFHLGQSWCKECKSSRGRDYRRSRREHIKLSARAYVESNREKINAQTAKRRFAKMRAIPKWFESDKVQRVYLEAQKRGLDVDHVVPLRSEIVCGLHCWANLQLMPQDLNRSKCNRHWPDMP